MNIGNLLLNKNSSYDAAIEKFNLALETLKDDEAKLRGMAIDVELSRFQVHLGSGQAYGSKA